jgi:hypothetical protein
MAPSNNIELISCDGSGKTIVAFINNNFFPEEPKEPKEPKTLESAEPNMVNLNELSLGGLTPVEERQMIFIVYNTNDDTPYGCYIPVGETDKPDNGYYINQRQISYSNCSDCLFDVGMSKFANPDVLKKSEDTKKDWSKIINRTGNETQAQ